MSLFNKKLYTLHLGSQEICRVKSLAEAKKSAQTDYECGILSDTTAARRVSSGHYVIYEDSTKGLHRAIYISCKITRPCNKELTWTKEDVKEFATMSYRGINAKVLFIDKPRPEEPREYFFLFRDPKTNDLYDMPCRAKTFNKDVEREINYILDVVNLGELLIPVDRQNHTYKRFDSTDDTHYDMILEYKNFEHTIATLTYRCSKVATYGPDVLSRGDNYIYEKATQDTYDFMRDHLDKQDEKSDSDFPSRSLADRRPIDPTVAEQEEFIEEIIDPGLADTFFQEFAELDQYAPSDFEHDDLY